MYLRKKLLSILFILSLVIGYLAPLTPITANAADDKTITVTLRVEEDESTMITPTTITLTESDMTDAGIGLPTDKLTPLHALAKYFTDTNGASLENMSDFIGMSSYGYLERIHGSLGTSTNNTDVYWMFAINDSAPIDASTGYGHSLSSYALEDGDEIVIYGIWGGDYASSITSYYSTFDRKQYFTGVNQDISLTLRSNDIYDGSGNTATTPFANAVILSDRMSSNVTSAKTPTNYKTDLDGKVTMRFSTPGTYVVSAQHYYGEGESQHLDLSRPYATITVNASSITQAKTPMDQTYTKAEWQKVFAKKINTYNYYNNSDPLILNDRIYIVCENFLYVLDLNGNILSETELTGSMNSVSRLTYGDGMLFVPLSQGRVQAFRLADNKVESLWVTAANAAYQSLSNPFYYNGYLYAGTTSSDGKNGFFYCLSTVDEDSTNPTEIKNYTWTYSDVDNLCGYYWSGATLVDDALVFGGDNGILVLHALTTDIVYDTISLNKEGQSGKIRSGIFYDDVTDSLFTTTNNGFVHKLSLLEGGLFDKNITSFHLDGSCTSTPTVYNGRVYVCSSQKISVLKAEDLSLIYATSVPADIKSTPLLTTSYATKENNNTVYLYFTQNIAPGGVYCLKDSETTTASTISTIFEPSGTGEQYCMSSVISDAKGTLYYSNDSGTFFAVESGYASVSIHSNITAPAIAVSREGINIDASGNQTYLLKPGQYTLSVQKEGYQTKTQTITISEEMIGQSTSIEIALAELIPSPTSTPTATSIPTPTSTSAPTPTSIPAPTSTPISISTPSSATTKLKTPKKFRILSQSKKKASKKYATFAWSSVKSATGYELRISKKKTKSFVLAGTTKKSTYSVRKLKKGTYYLKVRALRSSKGKKVYSTYSKRIKITIR